MVLEELFAKFNDASTHLYLAAAVALVWLVEVTGEGFYARHNAIFFAVLNVHAKKATFSDSCLTRLARGVRS